MLDIYRKLFNNDDVVGEDGGKPADGKQVKNK
jgi:hypothetical protein